jgi:hypothetical protein
MNDEGTVRTEGLVGSNGATLPKDEIEVKAIDLLKRIKADARAILDKYSTEASALATKSEDPHLPVVAAVQVALANAATDYMVTCGAKPQDAIGGVINTTGLAMQQWISALMGNAKVNPQAVPKPKKSKLILPDQYN